MSTNGEFETNEEGHFKQVHKVMHPHEYDSCKESKSKIN